MSFVWTFDGCMGAIALCVVVVILVSVFVVSTYKDWKDRRKKK
jgi:hypothetical protein